MARCRTAKAPSRRTVWLARATADCRRDTMRALVHHFGAIDRATRRTFEVALAAAGVAAEDRAASGTGAPDDEPVVAELYLVQRVGPTLLRALADARAERRRVLLMIAPGARLGPDDEWLLMDAGASDVQSWDRCPDPGAVVAARLRRWAQVDELLASDVVRSNLVGGSPAWSRVLREVVEVAAFTDAPVLLTGESGTGKELVARLIHTLDTRTGKAAMIVVDCTTIVPTLSGSEFFGHERGAFTGAVSARDGAFARADGGTLFLDEVGDLPLQLQAELLRVVQEGTFKRVGGNEWRTTRFRLVSATNRPLASAMDGGAFRPDLYHRIAAWTCELPPLRDRRDDIPMLTQRFLTELRPSVAPTLDPAVEQHLLMRSYPGNIRELRQLVARIAARHVGDGPITVGDLPETERPDTRPGPVGGEWWQPELDTAIATSVTRGVGLVEIGRVARELAVRHALDAEGGDTAGAARRLGVSERAIQARRAAGRGSARVSGPGP